jgi:hypothetical protein
MYTSSQEGSTPGTIAAKQFPELIENCNKEICWLCKTRTANVEYSYQVLFLKGRSEIREKTSSVSTRFTTRWTDEKFIYIPVCKECREAHEDWKRTKTAAMNPMIGIFIALLLVLSPLFATLLNLSQQYKTFSLWCGIPFGILIALGMAVSSKEIKQGQKRHKEVSIKEYPGANLLLSGGWEIYGMFSKGKVVYSYSTPVESELTLYKIQENT